MATGIRIKSATYGIATSSVDVSKEVLSYLQNGRISFVVSPAALNIQDPAPGQVKTLSAIYTINNGKNNSISVTDDQTFTIDAPPARIASGLQIKKAEYGYDTNYTDVTSAVRTYLDNGSIDMKVSPTTVGIPDPNPTKQKFLKVDVEINGEPSSYKIEDGKHFTLSAPAVDTLATESPSQSFGSFMGTFFNRIFTMLFLTFWFASTRVTYDYGKGLFNGGQYILGALTLATGGLFPVLILPFFTFVWKLIYG
jgi:hypothetical protein